MARKTLMITFCFLNRLIVDCYEKMLYNKYNE